MEKLYELIEQVVESTPQGSPTLDLRTQLEAYINELIQVDFPKLVDLLYRIDISEKKLKELFASQQNKDSASIITDLIIERQLQKWIGRQNQSPATDISEEDRW